MDSIALAVTALLGIVSYFVHAKISRDAEKSHKDSDRAHADNARAEGNGWKSCLCECRWDARVPTCSSSA